MTIAEPYSQVLMNRRPVLARLAVVLGVMISVATPTEHAAAQGTSSAVADPVRDSLAFELLKAHLTEYHLLPPTPQEMKAPGIAKTRS